MASSHQEQWIAITKVEFEALIENGTWQVISPIEEADELGGIDRLYAGFKQRQGNDA
jgi:hypothetical protein